MKREVGLWIDQHKAVIVTIIHPEFGIGRIHADMEKTVCFPESSSWNRVVQDNSGRKFANYLGSYYGDVLACIRDAESIQIFGPDEAKHDLERRLRYEELGGRIVGIESIEKMTDRQIEAKVWQYYLS